MSQNPSYAGTVPMTKIHECRSIGQGVRRHGPLGASMATKTSVEAVSAGAMRCCALPVALALLGLSLKPGGGLELLVQDPAAAPPVSVGFCEAS